MDQELKDMWFKDLDLLTQGRIERALDLSNADEPPLGLKYKLLHPENFSKSRSQFQFPRIWLPASSLIATACAAFALGLWWRVPQSAESIREMTSSEVARLVLEDMDDSFIDDYFNQDLYPVEKLL